MYDKHDVAAAATGRWREILLSLCSGLSDGCLTGWHQPCPKCGGNDRFRVFRDFEERGGAHCNQCFSENNADGFSFLQWWNGWKFTEALKSVAEFLRLPPNPPMAGRIGLKKQSPAPQPQTADELAAKWNQWTVDEIDRRSWAAMWAAKKSPVSPESVLACDVMIGNWPSHRDGQVCLGFWGWHGEKKNALLLYRADGTEFPAFGKLSVRKSHLVGGSKAGWIHVGGKARTDRAEVIWRVEGLPDGLALLPLLPPNHSCVSPSAGCGWNARDDSHNPPLSIFEGKVVVAVGDADVPGQRGLLRFAASASTVADRLFLAKLPYEISETHGLDLRDWIADGGDFADLQKLLTDYSKYRSALADILTLPDSQLVPEHAVVLSNYDMVDQPDRERPSFHPKPIPGVVEELHAITGQWPRRVRSSLFVHENDELLWLDDSSALFAWFGLKTGGTADFSRDSKVCSKNEIFKALQQRSIAYKAIERVPHEPPIDGYYYSCGEVESGSGECLAWLLDRFSPATEVDRDLIMLMLATAFWGGPPGQRPGFIITANGRGAGKSTLAMIAAELAGGLIDISQREDIQKIKQRILTAEGKDKRVVLIDNIKATRFSSAEMEALITSPVISGHEMYKSESQRPNTMLWLMTMNGVGLSRDIAQRVVVITLERPVYSGNWVEDTLAYVREHRLQIIADIVAFLRGPREKLSGASRWGSWDENVLARLPLPEYAQALILQRQELFDVDEDEAKLVAEHVRTRLKELRYDCVSDIVFVPSRLLNRWYNEALGERVSVTKSTQSVRGMIEEGTITGMQAVRLRDAGRGFYWCGENSDFDVAAVLTDIEHRIEMEQTSSQWGRE